MRHLRIVIRRVCGKSGPVTAYASTQSGRIKCVLLLLSLVTLSAIAVRAKDSFPGKTSTQTRVKPVAPKISGQKTVEELSAATKQSIVVISHFGRDGQIGRAHV